MSDDARRDLTPRDFILPQVQGGLRARLGRAWRALSGENLEWQIRSVAAERNHWHDTAKFFERVSTETRAELARVRGKSLAE
jgi:hypothetical protein